MSYFFAFILVCIIIWLFFGNQIRQWLYRRMMQKMEDSARRYMGMPTAKEERKRRKEAEKQARGEKFKSSFRRKNQTDFQPGPNANRSSSQAVGDVIIPREYAEDVEYVEYKEYSSTTVMTEETSPSGKKTSRIVTESQVSDVEYVEIKEKNPEK